MNIDHDRLRWFRLRRSGLVAPFPSAPIAAKALVGIQAQMLPAAGLALFNRCPGLTEALFDRLLHDARSLVRLWGQRGTLHVYDAGDWPLVVASRSKRLVEWESGPRPFGLPRAHFQAAVDEVERLLKDSESLGRKGLLASGLQLPDPCYNPWGGIYAVLVMRGRACHVRRSGGEGHFAHRHNWLPDLEWSTPTYEEASVEMVRRYASTYGPMLTKDLAWWAGATITEVRRWLKELDGELVPVDGECGQMSSLSVDVPSLLEEAPEPGKWPLTMLYRFDPLLVGYRDRSWLIDDEHIGQVSRPAGHIEGVILGPRDGRAIGTWRYSRTSSGLTVTVSPFRALSTETRRTIKAKARCMSGYFDVPLKAVSFERPDS